MLLAFASMSCAAAPVLWSLADGGNGHYYEAVAVTGGITWHRANGDALRRGGHLATLTSAAENSFVFALVGEDNRFWKVAQGYTYGPWLGAFQTLGSSEPAGGWRWVTGEPFEYSNWERNEPNNNGNEDRLHFAPSRTRPVWNDLSGAWPDLVNGYIVEYENDPAVAPSAGIVYFEDFENGAGAEWSDRTVSRSPTGNRGFLGRFGNRTVTLSLTHLPVHTNLIVSFDLYILSSWDGSSSPGPDVWELRRGDDKALLMHTTFSNYRYGGRHQAFPGNHPESRNLGHTGASEVATLGFGNADDVYPVRVVFPHVGDDIVLDFRASGLQGLNDESWGIDNVRIGIGNPPTVVLSTPGDWSGYASPTDLKIAADVADADRDVAWVDFFTNGRLLGSVHEPPYEFTWRNVTSGETAILVRATDSRGLTGEAVARVTIGGLRGEYFANTDLTDRRTVRLDPRVDSQWDDRVPVPEGLGDAFYSVRWTGFLVPEITGDYELSIRVDDGGRLWVNGRRVIDAWRGQSATTYTTVVPLERGRRHFLQMEYNNTGCCGAEARLRWARAGQAAAAIPQSVLNPPDPGFNRPPNVPVWIEPRQPGLTIDPRGFMLAVDFFSDANTGDQHAASDWEIWTLNPEERVWSATEVTGHERLRIGMRSGKFEGRFAGKTRLEGGRSYRLRTRHLDSNNAGSGAWGDWAEREFQTVSEVVLADSGSVTWRVPGWSSPWLAGMPDGSTANETDSAPGQSPVEVMDLPIERGSVLTFRASGTVRHGSAGTENGPDGGANVTHRTGAENGIATLTSPINSLIGLFLGDRMPDLASTPVGLNFGPVTSRDYSTLTPSLTQPFFIGDGRRSDGTVQSVTVPEGATRLFLGTMDGYQWVGNTGAFEVTIVPWQPASSENLAENGSFEAPGFSGEPGYRYLDHDDRRIQGWTISHDGVGERPYWLNYAHRTSSVIEGAYGVVLNQGSGAQTTVAASSNTTYRISFFLKALVGSEGLSMSPLRVRFGEDWQEVEPVPTWARQTLKFVAKRSDPATPLEFMNPSPAGDFRAYALDGVVVTQAPNDRVPPRLTAVGPGELILEGSLGARYELEITHSLQEPIAWTKVTETVLQTSPQRLAVALDPNRASGFYRLVERR